MTNSETEPHAKYYGHLTEEQLQGADYALRLLHTSPSIKGRALEILEWQMEQCRNALVHIQKLSEKI